MIRETVAHPGTIAGRSILGKHDGEIQHALSPTDSQRHCSAGLRSEERAKREMIEFAGDLAVDADERVGPRYSGPGRRALGPDGFDDRQAILPFERESRCGARLGARVLRAVPQIEASVREVEGHDVP